MCTILLRYKDDKNVVYNKYITAKSKNEATVFAASFVSHNPLYSIAEIKFL